MHGLHRRKSPRDGDEAWQLRIALELAGVGTTRIELATDTVFFDALAAGIMGLPNRASAEPFDIFRSRVHPEDRLKVAQSTERAIKTKGSYDVTYRVPKTDASVRWVRETGRSVEDDESFQHFLISTITDITERRTLEEDYHGYCERYRLIGLVTNDTIWEWDLITDEMKWNHHGHISFYYRHDEVGVHNDWWINRIHPDDRQRVLKGLREVIHSCDERWVDQYRFLGGNNEYAMVLDRGYVVRNSSGQPVKMIGSMMNITDRLRGEVERSRLRQECEESMALLDMLLDQAPVGMGFWDKNLHLIKANRLLAEVDDIPMRDANTDQEHMEHGGNSVPMLDALSHVLATGESATREVNRDDKSNLSATRYWTVSYYPVRVAHEILGVGVICDEVTGRKQAEAERVELLTRERVARIDAETANRLKDEFLANVSHELRTPLQAILGWAVLLRTDNISSENTSRGIESIERNARIQAKLIEDILDVSRIIEGKSVIAVQPIAVETFLSEAIETLRHTATSKNIQLVSRIEPELGMVMADEDRLQQVMWNLITNAIKFTQEGGCVEISAKRLTTHIELAVRDNGRGIPTDFVPYLFDRFRQADGGSTRRYGGLGLGLAIVKHFVDLHGGTVYASSPGEGLGATFTVLLPINAPVSEVRHDPPSSKRIALPPHLSLKGARVLIVDDQRDTRELMIAAVESAGGYALSASSAIEAMTIIEKELADVLVSDIGMPGENGYSLIQRVRSWEKQTQKKKSIPAVALTAYAHLEDERLALAAGYQRHVSKPIDPSKLIEIVSRLARRQRTSDSR